MALPQHSLNIPEHVPRELVIDFDATYDAGLAVDVFARLSEVRDTAPPIAYSPYNGGHWMVFDGDYIKSVLARPEIFTSTHISAGSLERGGPPMIPLGMDPPEHGPWRVILTRHLGPSRVRELEKFIRQKAEELVQAAAECEAFDFVTTVAEPYPISIFMALMGLPAERFPEFRRLALAVLSAPNSDEPQPEVMAANQQIMAILSEVIAHRTHSPTDDLISALLAEQVNGEPIGDQALMSICYVLFLGGLDTVTNALSFAMRYLAQHPGLQRELRNHPERIPDVTEDLLSLTAFVNTNRMVKTDTRLGDVQMKSGDFVWNMSWAGCNTSEGLNRQQGQFAFGGGPHMCAGMHLARMELRLFYETWFARIGEFSLQDDPEPAMKGGSIMEIKRLLLELPPRTESGTTP